VWVHRRNNNNNSNGTPFIIFFNLFTEILLYSITINYFPIYFFIYNLKYPLLFFLCKSSEKKTPSNPFYSRLDRLGKIWKVVLLGKPSWDLLPRWGLWSHCGPAVLVAYDIYIKRSVCEYLFLNFCFLVFSPATATSNAIILRQVFCHNFFTFPAHIFRFTVLKSDGLMDKNR